MPCARIVWLQEPLALSEFFWVTARYAGLLLDELTV